MYFGELRQRTWLTQYAACAQCTVIRKIENKVGFSSVWCRLQYAIEARAIRTLRWDRPTSIGITLPPLSNAHHYASDSRLEALSLLPGWTIFDDRNLFAAQK